MRPFAFLQKYSVLQIWRATVFFLSSIWDKPDVMAALKRINGMGVGGSVEVVKPSLFSETGCLTVTDMRAFGDWLVTQPTVTSAMLAEKMSQLYKRRLVKMHLTAAPAERVRDAPCMFPSAMLTARGVGTSA